MSNNENKSITPLRKYIAIGYAVIALLIGGIVFIYLHEWRELERIEAESKEMNMLRQKVHDAYAQMLNLTLYGEKVLERYGRVRDCVMPFLTLFLSLGGLFCRMVN